MQGAERALHSYACLSACSCPLANVLLHVLCLPGLPRQGMPFMIIKSAIVLEKNEAHKKLPGEARDEGAGQSGVLGGHFGALLDAIASRLAQKQVLFPAGLPPQTKVPEKSQKLPNSSQNRPAKNIPSGGEREPGAESRLSQVSAKGDKAGQVQKVADQDVDVGETKKEGTQVELLKENSEKDTSHVEVKPGDEAEIYIEEVMENPVDAALAAASSLRNTTSTQTLVAQTDAPHEQDADSPVSEKTPHQTANTAESSSDQGDETAQKQAPGAEKTLVKQTQEPAHASQTQNVSPHTGKAAPVQAMSRVLGTQNTNQGSVHAESEEIVQILFSAKQLLRLEKHEQGFVQRDAQQQQALRLRDQVMTSLLLKQSGVDLGRGDAFSSSHESFQEGKNFGLSQSSTVQQTGNGAFQRSEHLAEAHERRASEMTERLPRHYASRSLEKVEEALKEAARSRDGKTLSLRLDPPSLGSVRVDVSIRDGALHARIAAENPNIQNLLRDKALDLQQSLRSLGLDVEQVTVSVGDYDSKSGDMPRPKDKSAEEAERDDDVTGHSFRREGSEAAKNAGGSSLQLKSAVLDHWIA